MNLAKTFDRVDDVSKIEGCNTRGVEYRWSTFSNVIASIPVGSNALDFGAGSLRESFDLAVRGFNVTSIDIDSELMSAYKSSYDWPANGASHHLIAASDLTDGLTKIGDTRFALVTCFDVLEHLEDPGAMLRLIEPYLADDGKIFITVPNGRTLFELAFRFDLLLARATKRYMRVQVDALGLSERICSGARMAAIDRIDQKTKSIFRGLYGWNLFVASPVRNRSSKHR